MVYSVEIKYQVKPGKRPSKTIEGRLRSWQDQTTRRLAQIPGAVKYPIRWTSERQRRAFFATDGFGRGIPTRRTGRVAQWGVFVDYDAIDDMRSWLFQLQLFLANLNPRKQARLSSPPGEGLLARIANTASYQRYVTGIDQQGFHADTGWIYAPTEIASATQDLNDIMQDTGLL